MSQSQEDDLIRVKELLRHTGEFIAYFELAETKMMEWRGEMEQRSLKLTQQSENLQKELVAINELLSQAGTARFRVLAEKAFTQGKTQLQLMERSCNQFTERFQEQQEQLEVLTSECVYKLEQSSAQATQTMADQLAKYDAHQFHRIAYESCDHVERVANNAVHKSNKLFSMFQMRFGIFTIFTTILTAFVVGMYVSGELPWEQHHNAINERHAGKALLQAWPNLTLEEKTKILSDNELPHGG